PGPPHGLRDGGPASESHRSLIEPKKLPNPVRESKHHRELHRELIFTQRRGILPEHKPELQRVLEARRIKQLKQQEETQKPLTDLEEELRKRQQKLDQVFIICSPVKKTKIRNTRRNGQCLLNILRTNISKNIA
uniref:Family with sequence similarity 107 member A n=1 Tax=Podarcis muralis TaxID=64176 RepID=A0A670J6I5_PODMU